MDFTLLHYIACSPRLYHDNVYPIMRDSRLNPSNGKRMPQIVEMKIFDPGFLQRRAEEVTGWKAFFDSRILLLSPLASARVQLGRLRRIIINH